MAGAEARIGLVIGQLTAGGAEHQLALLARSLQGGRFRPTVFCLSGKSRPLGSELEAEGIEVRVIAGPPLLRVARLARALEADRIGLVHSWLFIANTYAWLANRRRRPLITSARNCKRQGPMHDNANRFAFRASRRVIANSHMVKHFIEQEFKAPSERIAVIHNGIDVARFSPAPRAAEEALRRPLIVGVGRLVPQKDPELFVRAAARLAAARPEARFAFIGEGPMRAALEKLIGDLGLRERIALPGETRDVPGVLRRATLFWLTSAWEGLPNVVLEALASGVPTIAADVGGTRELVRPEIEGFLVRAGDADAFLAHSLALLADTETYAAYAARARARAMEFSTAKMVEAMTGLYEEVLRQGPGGRGPGASSESMTLPAPSARAVRAARCAALQTLTAGPRPLTPDP